MNADAQKTKRIAVSTSTLYTWITREQMRMPFGAAWRIVSILYCGRLFSGGTCPLANGGDCETCKPYIQRIFAFDEANNPQALASWIAKREAAVANEKMRAAQRSAASDAGSQDGRPKPEPNPFETFLTTLE